MSKEQNKAFFVCVVSVAPAACDGLCIDKSLVVVLSLLIHVTIKHLSYLQGHGAVHMEVMLTGFNTSEDFASHHHGLHMHEYGDLSEGCGSVGELYHNEHAPDHA